MFTEVDKTTPKQRNFFLVSSLGSGSITGLSYVLKRKAYITFLPKLLCTKLKPNYSVKEPKRIYIKNHCVIYQFYIKFYIKHFCFYTESMYNIVNILHTI